MAVWWTGANAAAAAGWVQDPSYHHHHPHPHHPGSSATAAAVLNGFHHHGGSSGGAGGAGGSAAEYFESPFNSASAFVAPSFMTDCYKSVLPAGFLAPPPPPPSAVAGLGSAAAGAPSGGGSRSHRRYTGRSTCDCPNCQEADRLGPAAALHLRKRSVHSCHLPGCGKVYNKTSHLKASTSVLLRPFWLTGKK